MTPLQNIFEKTLPALLQQSPVPHPGILGFTASSGPETGYWVVSLTDRTSRRGTAEDRPETMLDASADTWVLLFSGALDVRAALRAGVIGVQGPTQALEQLASMVGAAPTR